jgi:hypothetical protein
LTSRFKEAGLGSAQIKHTGSIQIKGAICEFSELVA